MNHAPKKQVLSFLPILAIIGLSQCSAKTVTETQPPNIPTPPTVVLTNDITVWLTKPDQSALLTKQAGYLSFSQTNTHSNTIVVDTTLVSQTMDGFGFTLTGGSATLINQMGATEQSNLLQELFGNNENSIGISALRISIGASDLSASSFTYDEIPSGEKDLGLAKFSMAMEEIDLIPILKKIIAINPSIKIMASPWTAPTWMKDNTSFIGGSLLPSYYQVYADYLIMYLQQMKAKGINIDALTIQNEPEHGGNNPSMLMSWQQQADFVKNYLGPSFAKSSIATKIIIWDHNCDNPNYPINILNDAAAKNYIDGSAFHLYAGDVSALSVVKAAHPDKNIYFTEQWTGSTGTFSGDLAWHIKNVMIGSVRNSAKMVLEWNLANDPSFGPHTAGGCTQCKGALTISGNSVNRNVSYYIIAQMSKFVPMGAKRISSGNVGGLYSAAFINPDGKKVMIVYNDNSTDTQFSINYKLKFAAANLPSKSVATYRW